MDMIKQFRSSAGMLSSPALLSGAGYQSGLRLSGLSVPERQDRCKKFLVIPQNWTKLTGKTKKSKTKSNKTISHTNKYKREIMLCEIPSIKTDLPPIKIWWKCLGIPLMHMLKHYTQTTRKQLKDTLQLVNHKPKKKTKYPYT